jgi:hypothetical protein
VSVEIAESGWVVEVVLTTPDDQPDSRFFAVGIGPAIEAEEAVLRFPGLMREDRRIARRRLSSAELAALGLGTQAVRPYRTTSWEQRPAERPERGFA